jgi:hypothetical protein
MSRRARCASGRRVPIFLLSPARCDGKRARILLNPKAEFPLAMRLREKEGAPIGEVFAFLSGLYFRGKLAYAGAFGPRSSYVITTDRGLVSPNERITRQDIEAFACVDLADAGDEFLGPLRRDATRIARESPEDLVVLLGSIATKKYVEPLLVVFGERLVFPREFVGRGDMSRGGLLLRHVDSGQALEYTPVATAIRHGKRPPKLAPRT